MSAEKGTAYSKDGDFLEICNHNPITTKEKEVKKLGVGVTLSTAAPLHHGMWPKAKKKKKKVKKTKCGRHKAPHTREQEKKLVREMEHSEGLAVE